MQSSILIQQLADNAARIQALASHIDTEAAHWKPDPQTWSLVEVINHLADEERQDFRVRIDYFLHRPGEEPPLIDPLGWVIERAYNQRELADSLADFLAERERSIAWLRGLQDADWNIVVSCPWGEMQVGDFFAAWVAHDLLHMRQLVEVLWAMTNRLCQPYSTRYAGDW